MFVIGVGAAALDTQPYLEAHLCTPGTIDRVTVSSHSLGSIVSGLRTYTVSVMDAFGNWTDVGTVTGSYAERSHTLTFAARSAAAVRVRVSAVNYSG